MRKIAQRFLIVALLALATAGGVVAAYNAFLGVPTNVAARVEVHRGNPDVIVTWSDTNATIARSDISRRSTGADTFWSIRGYTRGTVGRFRDQIVACDKTYRYRVRDSIAGQVKSAWSDSASVTVTCQNVSP